MNASGQLSLLSPSSGSIDIDRMTLQAIVSELKAFRPITENDVRSDPAWLARRAALWRRFDLIREMEKLYRSYRR